MYTFVDLVADMGPNPVDLQHHIQTQLNMDVLQITDFCPEWAFPEVRSYPYNSRSIHRTVR